jgi:hypothetical protein
MRKTYTVSPWLGLAHWDGRRWTSHGLQDLQTSAYLRQVLALNGGRAMLRSSVGSSYFDGQRWQSQGPAQGLGLAELSMLSRDAADGAYAISADGLFHHEGNRWRSIDTRALPDPDLHWLGIGPAGELWIQGDGFLAVSADPLAPAGPNWTAAPSPPRLPVFGEEPIMAGVDRLGRPWALGYGASTGPERGAIGLVLDGGVWTPRYLDAEIGTTPGAFPSAVSVGSRPAIGFGVGNQVWVGNFYEGLRHFDGQSWARRASHIGPSHLIAFSVKPDPAGGVWLGHAPIRHPDRLLDHFDGTSWQHVGAADGLPTGGLLGIMPSRLDVAEDGTVWLASDRNGDILGWLAWNADGRWQSRQTSDLFGSDVVVACVTADERGGVWLGSPSGALHFEAQSGRIQRYTTADGLADNDIQSIAVDRRGGADRVWFGTQAGLSRLEAGRFTNFTQAGATPIGSVSAILVDEARDSLWIGDAPGAPGARVLRLKDGRWTVLDAAQGLTGDGIWDLGLAPDGTLWAAVADDSGEGSGLGRFDGRHWTTYREADGLISDDVFDVAVDAKGTVWAATIAGLSELSPADLGPSVPYPEPTDPPICICSSTRQRAPADILAAVVANPNSLGGYGAPRDAGKPISPFNPPRTCLGIHNAGVVYHPLFNPLAWKAGCP